MYLTSGRILGVPVQGIILILVYLLAAFWLRYRPTGRAIYAVGGNDEVARLSGLNVTSIKIRVYIIASVLAALAGMLIDSQPDSAQPMAGTADLRAPPRPIASGGPDLRCAVRVGRLLTGAVAEFGPEPVTANQYLRVLRESAPVVGDHLAQEQQRRRPAGPQQLGLLGGGQDRIQTFLDPARSRRLRAVRDDGRPLVGLHRCEMLWDIRGVQADRLPIDEPEPA